MFDLASKLRMRSKHLAHFDEDADDQHIHFSSSVATEDTGKHGNRHVQ